MRLISYQIHKYNFGIQPDLQSIQQNCNTISQFVDNHSWLQPNVIIVKIICSFIPVNIKNKYSYYVHEIQDC